MVNGRSQTRSPPLPLVHVECVMSVERDACIDTKGDCDEVNVFTPRRGATVSSGRGAELGDGSNRR